VTTAQSVEVTPDRLDREEKSTPLPWRSCSRITTTNHYHHKSLPEELQIDLELVATAAHPMVSHCRHGLPPATEVAGEWS